VVKAKVPEGKKEIHRRVDPAVCTGWVLDHPGSNRPVAGCTTILSTHPKPFKAGERIEKITLLSMCQSKHERTDIRISWQPAGGEHPEARREVVKVATDVTLPKGETTLNLVGGGVGREGTYMLEIEGLGAFDYVTRCTAWTIGRR
jgi:hypothetical protein